MGRNCLIWVVLLAFGASQVSAERDAPSFENDVRPVLKAHCFHCHGEGEELASGLDLRLKRFIQTGGDSGPAIVPGNSNESLLVEYLTSGVMPPEGTELRPSQQEIQRIKEWVDSGAVVLNDEPESLPSGFYVTEQEKKHWAFQPITSPSPPMVNGTADNAIDQFLLSKLEAVGLGLSDRASRTRLIRRAYLDLLGIPPTPEQTDRFIADQRPDSYSRLIDELLTHHAYGERWGRHWLDIAGYADSEGMADADAVRSQAYRYRDYVIRSINSDKPYDRFVIEQLAGDELASLPFKNMNAETIDLLTATGFLRMAPDGTGSGSPNTNIASNAVMSATIKTVSTSLLGLTVGCAQCHNHRYDPISQEEYYQFRAIFEPALNWNNWKTPQQRQISLYTDADVARSAEIEAEAAKILEERETKQAEYIAATFEKELAKLPEEVREPLREVHATPAGKRTPEQEALLQKHPSANVTAGSLYLYDQKAADDLKSYSDRATELRGTKPAEGFLRALTEPADTTVPETFVFFRGDIDQPKQAVQPGELRVLSSADSTIPANDTSLPTSGRRLNYAKWLTSGEHPLLARVIANRIWMHHFGTGLVNTPGDFGILGAKPTHPALLDWLATELMTNGWSVKHLHRLIMTSRAYQQSSKRNAQGQEKDALQQLIWAMPVRRLESEVVRDSILSIVEKLSASAYGEPVPVMADRTGQWVIGQENLNAGRPGAVVDMKGDQYRRSIYIQVRRSRPLAVLETFDLPELAPNCTKRAKSTASTQALMMMNSSFVVEQSESFADRLITAQSESENQLKLGWKLAFSEEIPADVLEISLQFLADTKAEFVEANPEQEMVDELSHRHALALFCQAMFSSNQFLYIE